MHSNNEEFECSYDRMQAEISHLLEGKKVALSVEKIKLLESKPEWLDEDKIKRGQEFAKNYYFVVSFSELISLYLLFSVDSILNPLIFTNKSSTVKTAFNRYFSTILRVKSWYDSDILDSESDSRKNVDIVNRMHTAVLSQMSMKTEEEMKFLTSLKDRLEGSTELWSSGCPFIRKDLDSIYDEEPSDREESFGEKYPHINQYNMVVTQFGFVGLTVVYAEKLGVLVSDYEMESFMHLWRYIGYLVGIEDEYNLCNGSYDQVLFKCKSIIELIVKPNLANVKAEWEHMSHAVCEAVDIILNEIHFESSVCLLMYVLDLDFDEYYKTLTLEKKFNYYYFRFILGFLIPIPFIRDYLNNVVRKKINDTHIKYNENKLFN